MATRKHDDWLDVPAVMKRLGMCRGAVYKALKTGRLKSRKIRVTREVIRVDPASVAAFHVSKPQQQSGKRSARLRRQRTQALDKRTPTR